MPEFATKGLRSFLGLFANEHVAATELLIGPLFVPLNLPVPQLTDWAPNSVGMVLVVLAMGAVIALVAAKGYDAVLHAAGLASAEAGQFGILAGTIGWFATAPFWIRKRK